MKAISLKLPDDLLEVSAACASALHVSRAQYIRDAIDLMNRATLAQVRARRLADVSLKVRAESMRVNEAFAAIEHSARP